MYVVQSVTLNTGGRDLSGAGRPQHISNTDNTHAQTHATQKAQDTKSSAMKTMRGSCDGKARHPDIRIISNGSTSHQEKQLVTCRNSQ